MANMMPRAKQVQVARALVEGLGVRATARLVDISIEGVLSVLVRVGGRLR
jgi:transposase-like protein